MSKLSAEQRIERCHVQLMKHKNFALFSGLFMIGKVSVDDATPTACTNGMDVIYGREFVQSLNDKQLAFLILHENMHKAYRHLVVWEKLYKRNAVLANIACDYVINLQIHDYDPNHFDTEMPTNEEGKPMGCFDEKYRGMDSQEVFLKLIEEKGEDYGKGKGKTILVAGEQVMGTVPMMAREFPHSMSMIGKGLGMQPKKKRNRLAKKSSKPCAKVRSL
jgi:predicted metal-dependent peptidase